MKAYCNGFLLDENQGEFVADDGRKVEYHNARFYNIDESKIVKATVAKDSDALPEPQVHVVLEFDVNAGEKFCRLVYRSCDRTAD